MGFPRILVYFILSLKLTGVHNGTRISEKGMIVHMDFCQ